MTKDKDGVDRWEKRHPETDIMPAVQTNKDIMMEAVRKGLGKDQLEVLERMFEFDLKVKEQQAKEAFYQAKAAFKADVPVVIKDKENKQYKSMYATEDALFNTVNPVLAKHGLETSFSYPKSEDPKIFIVRCTLAHVLGHSENVEADGPLDTSGSKNPLQQCKSTRTYLKKEAYTAITGIASADVDDDGNLSGQPEEAISDEQFIKIKELLEASGADEKRFCKFLEIDNLDVMPVSKFKKAKQGLEDKLKGKVK